MKPISFETSHYLFKLINCIYCVNVNRIYSLRQVLSCTKLWYKWLCLIEKTKLETDRHLVTESSNTSVTVIRRLSLVEQELPTRPEHLGSLPILNGVRACCSIFSFPCPSSIYAFWLLLWYLKTFLGDNVNRNTYKL